MSLFSLSVTSQRRKKKNVENFPLGFCFFLAIAVQLWSNVLFTARGEYAECQQQACWTWREWPAPGCHTLTRSAARMPIQTRLTEALHTHTPTPPCSDGNGPRLQLRPPHFTVSQTSLSPRRTHTSLAPLVLITTSRNVADCPTFFNYACAFQSPSETKQDRQVGSSPPGVGKVQRGGGTLFP